MKKKIIDIETMAQGVLEKQAAVLGRAITLVESQKPEHQEQAQKLLKLLLPHTGRAFKVGISGVPGVGKSSFIEALGVAMIQQKLRVGVIAVDPSSEFSGGSILGDKTRMTELSRHTQAFIRPEASAGKLGGVARKTRDVMVILDAAGYDYILVETVGVGQSEYQVKQMVDYFVGLFLPGAGDELQGIKKGILEVVDLLVVNKADGDQERLANLAKAQFHGTLSILRGGKTPEVFLCSATEKKGIQEILNQIKDDLVQIKKSGELELVRRKQMQYWVEALLLETFEQEITKYWRLNPLSLGQFKEILRGHSTPYLTAQKHLKTALKLLEK